MERHLTVSYTHLDVYKRQQLVDLSENKAIMNLDVLSFKRLAYRVFDELGITKMCIRDRSRVTLH